MRAQVEKELLGDQPARPAVIQRHLDRQRRDDASGSHDEFRAGGLEPIEMKGDETVDHVALALKNPLHVDRYIADIHAELSGAGDDPRDTGAPDFVLAGKTIDVRTGAADPAAFYHGGFLPGLSKIPCEVFAAFATADDNGIVLFRFGHRCLPSKLETRLVRPLARICRFDLQKSPGHAP